MAGVTRAPGRGRAPGAGRGRGPGALYDENPLAGITVSTVTPQPRRPRPACYSATGTWPDGPLNPDAPPQARLAQGIAQRLQDRLQHMTVYRAAKRSGLSAQTIHNILKGRTWPDLPHPRTPSKRRSTHASGAANTASEPHRVSCRLACGHPQNVTAERRRFADNVLARFRQWRILARMKRWAESDPTPQRG